MGALQAAGLELVAFREFSYSPYNCFPNLVEVEPGQYHVRGHEGRLPMVFSLEMRRRG